MANVNIDLDELKDIALRGVRRASVFMGLGINAANDDNYKEYQLDKYTAIKIIPDKLDDNIIKHFKEEFSSWIIMNGLRELIETFSLFLDKVFNVCFLVSSNKFKLDNKNIYFKFPQCSLKNKIKKLDELFSIMIKHIDCIGSINQARNCYTHRNGIVGVEDCSNGTLDVKWISFDISILFNDGKELMLDLPLREQVRLETPGRAQCKMANRNLVFNVGEVLCFSPKQLSEICYFFNGIIKEVMVEVIHFFEVSGIELKIKGGN